MIVTLRAYAKMKGVSATTIHNRIQAGILKNAIIDGDGPKMKIDSEIADREWEENKDEVREQGQKLAEASGLASPKKKSKVVPIVKEGEDSPAATPEEEVVRELDPFKSLAMARHEKEIYESKLRRLKWEKEDGTLIEVEVVQKRIHELALVTKEALLNLPDQIGPQLLSFNDLTELQNFLRQALNDCLAKLSEAGDAGQS